MPGVEVHAHRVAALLQAQQGAAGGIGVSSCLGASVAALDWGTRWSW